MAAVFIPVEPSCLGHCLHHYGPLLATPDPSSQRWFQPSSTGPALPTNAPFLFVDFNIQRRVAEDRGLSTRLPQARSYRILPRGHLPSGFVSVHAVLLKDGLLPYERGPTGLDERLPGDWSVPHWGAAPLDLKFVMGRLRAAERD